MVTFARAYRILLDVLSAELEPIAPAERRLADRHLVERDAERVDIGALVNALASRLFRRHVFGRAHVHRCSRGRRVVRRSLGDSEVGHHRIAVAIEENVVGLQIAVHDPAIVCVGELKGRGNVHPHTHDQRAFYWLARLHDVVEPSFQQVHREEDDLVLFARVVDGDDVRMPELRGAVRFAPEVFLEDVVVGERGLEDLERDVDFQVGVARPVDVGEAALTEGLIYPVDRHGAAQEHVLFQSRSPCNARRLIGGVADLHPLLQCSEEALCLGVVDRQPVEFPDSRDLGSEIEVRSEPVDFPERILRFGSAPKRIVARG